MAAFLGAALLVVVGGGAAFLLRPFDAVTTEVVQDGLEHPWDIAFDERGRMLVTERIGRVRVFASEEPRAALLHSATVPGVRAELESGLMGIAVHDDTVIVCASRDTEGDGGEQWRVELLRSTLAGDGSLGPFEILPIGAANGGPRHQGCAVEVDADGLVWVSIGDGNVGPDEHPAQDPAALNGKILRFTLDGAVPPDAPFASGAVSIGHRNPQGIAIRDDGLVVTAEHGTDENDELNVVVPGGNYGYPCWTGADAVGPFPAGCGPASEYDAPAWTSGSPTLATSGATFLSGDGWTDWEGDLIVSTLKEEDLRRFTVTADGEIAQAGTLLDGRFGRLRAVAIGPDGALYVSSSNGTDDRIVRVTRR